MAKKDFTGSIGRRNLNKLIPTNEPEQKEQQVDPTPTPTKKVVQKKRTATKTKAKKAPVMKAVTFRLDEDTHELIKAVAFWERAKIQEVVDQAFQAYLATLDEDMKQKAIVAYRKKYA